MKTTKAVDLKEKLIRSGLSRAAIQAAWPRWWRDDAADSPSAFNDLRFSLSRKLGIAPTSLFDEGDAVFVWQGNAKFKGLSVENDVEHQALVGYATALSNIVFACSDFPERSPLTDESPEALRNGILRVAQFVGLSQLLGLAYSMGVPVLHLQVFPLESKKMTAMSVKAGDRHLILLGRDALHSPWYSFYVAHELAHIILGHLGSSGVLVDAEIKGENTDEEEAQADRFALALLTGHSNPEFELNRRPKSATELANAVAKAGAANRIDPGTLALCYGFSTKDWTRASGALKWLYGKGNDLGRSVNTAATRYLDFSRLTEDNRAFLYVVLGLDQWQR
ncbi:MAG TPA: ImmA/IrrE family metallo-endopeptidase [Candidatus Acidoferrum sp.]|nr:ImmA/IrrE family metallo-endopeptidase [Candidatus Acidoferrum sp.]